MSNPNVQLAFQGGGAKLAVMLPVADAFLKAKKRNLINITAVSGTSAGAICAALVACEADFTKVLDFLRVHGGAWANAMVPAPVRPLREAGAKFGWWQIFSHRELLKDLLLRGKPLLDGKALNGFIGELLNKTTNTTNPNIENRVPNLSIIASDIAASKAVIHKSGNLVSALVDSCSLPIVFRSFNTLSKTHYVDGGLCDNLPVEGLLSNREAATFAIFPIEEADGNGEPKNNILTYLLSLFSASINHGVSRSIAMVSEPFRFGIETKLGLLQFEEAIALLQQPEWYDTRRDEAFKRIGDFARSYGVINDPSDARVVDVIDIEQYQEALTELSDGFASHLQAQRARFTVRVNCGDVFKDEKDATDRTSDTITRVTEFKVLSEKASCYRTHLIMTNDNIVPTILSARNLTRDLPIPIRALALGKASFSSGDFKGCLIQFIDAPLHLAVDDLIEIRGVYHSTPKGDMRLLNFLQNDHLGYTNPQLPTIAKAELVLIYPKRIGPLRLIDHPKCSRQQQTEAMTFDKSYRDYLGEDLDVTGIFLRDLKNDERLFAYATKVQASTDRRTNAAKQA